MITQNREAGQSHAGHTISTHEEEIRAWLLTHLADALEIDAQHIDIDAPFDRYGLDSFVAVNLVGELQDWLGCELSPSLPYDYPSVAKLAHHLSERPTGETKQ